MVSIGRCNYWLAPESTHIPPNLRDRYAALLGRFLNSLHDRCYGSLFRKVDNVGAELSEHVAYNQHI